MKPYPTHPVYQDQAQYADLYILDFNDGSTVYLTDFDRDVVVGKPTIATLAMNTKYSSWTYQKFISAAPLISRSRLNWKVGMEPSEVTVTIMNDPAVTFGHHGLTVSAAVAAGVFDGAIVRIWRAYWNTGVNVNLLQNINPLVYLPDGSVGTTLGLPVTPIQLFMGELTKAGIDRLKATLKFSDPRTHFNRVLPKYTFQPSCRWTVYDAGCLLLAANFQVNWAIELPFGYQNTTTNFWAPNPFPTFPVQQQTGYYDLGYVQFTSGNNAGVRRTVTTFLAPDTSYWLLVLYDHPIAYYRMNDPVGSSGCRDWSGNGFNGTVFGPVKFGQTGLRTGDSSTCALLGSNQPTASYITCPLSSPPPWQMPNYGGAVTFEFIVAPPTIGIPVMSGLYDTGPGQNGTLRCFEPPISEGGNPQGITTFDWNVLNGVNQGLIDSPAISTPSTISPTHYVVVYRGNRYMDVYQNGFLIGSDAAGGPFGPAPFMSWGTATKNYGPNGATDQPTIGICRELGGPLTQVAQMAGFVQDFAIYNYAFSASQALIHAQVALNQTASLPAHNFTVDYPFPYAPQMGDTFIAVPGCDRTRHTCQFKFNNLVHYGGTDVIPEEDTGL